MHIYKISNCKKNIGLDGSGTHSGKEDVLQETVSEIKISLILDLKENSNFYYSYHFEFKEKVNIWEKLKKFFQILYHQYF